MPRRKTDAYKVFEKNVKRSRAFLRLFDLDRTAGKPSNDERELLRGAVVFVVGALDGFLHDLILEIVPKFGGNQSALRDALRSIAKQDASLALRVALAPDDSSRRSEFKSALDDWLAHQSFQGPAKVDAALTYVGSRFTIEDLDAHTGVNTAERLAYFTDMRHSIVHRGARPHIVRNTAGQCVELVANIGAAINRDVLRFYNNT